MDGTKKEEVLARNDELKEENEQLRKLVQLTQKRHKKEADKRDRDLESMASELENTRKEGDKMREALEEQTTTSNFLREDLTECKARIGALTRRSDALSAELDSARRGEQSWADLDGLYRSLAQEMSRCLREIKSLSETTKQIVGGEDPKTRIFTDNPELNSGIVGFGLGLGGALLAGALLDNARRNQNPCDHYHYRDVTHDQPLLYI